MEDNVTCALAVIGLALMLISAALVVILGHHTALPAWAASCYAAALIRHRTRQEKLLH